MDNSLKHNLSAMGMVLLVMTLCSNLLNTPFLMLSRYMRYYNGYGFSPFISQLAQTLIYCGTMLAAIFFGAWLLRCGRELLFPLSTPRMDYLCPAVGMGLGVGMASNIVTTLITIVLAFGGVGFQQNAPDFNGGIATTLFTLISVAVLPAILEELLFRGVLLQPLRKYGDRVAIVLSALMFAFCHPTLPQAINAFIMGLCFGLFAVRSGSLVVPMLIHLIYNSAACLLTLVGTHLPLPVTSAVNWLLIFSLLIAGIYSFRLLKRRFGSVLWVSPAAAIPVSGKQTAFTAFCSLPFMLSLLLNTDVMLRSMYTYF